MTARVSLFLSLCLTLWGASALGQSRVLEISGASFRPVPLAIAPPSATAPAAAFAATVDRTLAFDLAASGLFQVLDRRSFLADAKEGLTAKEIRFDRWTAVGAELLLKLRISRSGDRFRTRLVLFAVGPQREELVLEEEVSATDPRPRALAHTLAKGIHRHFTRDDGPYDARLVYVRKDGRDRSIWIADWDGQGAVPVVTDDLNILPTVTPDGRGAAFTSYARGRPALYRAVPRGRLVPLVQQEGMATGIDYSPDGKRIAYALSEGAGAQIWTADADGRNPKKVTDTPSFINTSPSWSPDGEQLAFVSNRAGSPQIYAMRADGSRVRRLTFQGSYNQTPDWSPRGDAVAFTARDERNAFDLFTVNVETKEIQRLTQGSGNNEEPAYSPDGRLIVFSSTRSGTERLYVMTAEGKNQLPLPMGKGTFLTPVWGGVR